MLTIPSFCHPWRSCLHIHTHEFASWWKSFDKLDVQVGDRSRAVSTWIPLVRSFYVGSLNISHSSVTSLLKRTYLPHANHWVGLHQGVTPPYTIRKLINNTKKILAVSKHYLLFSYFRGYCVTSHLPHEKTRVGILNLVLVERTGKRPWSRTFLSGWTRYCRRSGGTGRKFLTPNKQKLSVGVGIFDAHRQHTHNQADLYTIW